MQCCASPVKDVQASMSEKVSQVARTHPRRLASVHVTRACTPTHTPTQGRRVWRGGAGFQIWDLELGENVGEEQQLLSSYGKMDGMRAIK